MWMRLLLAQFVVAAALPAVGGSAPGTDTVQARYDAARDLEEHELHSRRPDLAAIRAARGRIGWAERIDKRPRSWRGGHDVPAFALHGARLRARAVRVTDGDVATKLAALGRSYRGWAAFWIHGLATGRAAGWNSDARFPAASLVKLGPLVAALRAVVLINYRSPLW